MFRNHLPFLTCLVFSVGLAIGFSWSRGYIPLAIAPAKTGTLGIEVAQREPLPLPNRSPSSKRRAAQEKVESVDESEDESIVFEQQSEPDLDSTIAVTRQTEEKDYSQVIPVARQEEPEQVASREPAALTLPDSDQGEPLVENSKPIRLLKKGTGQPVPESSPKPRKGAQPRRVVSAAAHQTPADPPSESDSTTEDAQGGVSEQLAAAEEKLAAGEVLAAHRILSKLYWNHQELRPQLQEKIDAAAKSIFFDSQPHFIEPYVIQSGDRLEVIAKKYQLSWEYLAKLNRTEPRRIQIGQKLKVLKGPFAAVVELNRFELIVHLQGYYVKRYMVCTGKDNSSPVGKFTVLNKVVNPPYTGPDGKVIAADDPSNPLGERWIDLGDSYGIHGTIDPGSIGKAESRGCIRLGDEDVIEVYNFLVKGSEVVIRK
ncbi:L,D-transpeptidase family protein [Schlesneria sp. T3-172]|uniref:L,D-transpeptidase family protein n=1 Tax=Schlesneria sphaerica TaxID=3373610 RepID=UPI0037CB8582